MTQGLSRALWEQVTFNRSNVTSLDWVTYPILRFAEAPKLTFKVIQRTDIPSTDTGTVAHDGVLATGSGEPPTAPIAAAVANAIFDATGVRITQTPMTPSKVKYFLKNAGVA
jgi:CO/xanthine dehydrogenase Mo-binding subunit